MLTYLLASIVHDVGVIHFYDPTVIIRIAVALMVYHQSHNRFRCGVLVTPTEHNLVPSVKPYPPESIFNCEQSGHWFIPTETTICYRRHHAEIRMHFHEECSQ